MILWLKLKNVENLRKFVKIVNNLNWLNILLKINEWKTEEEINAVNAYKKKKKIDIRIYVNNVIKNIKMELKNLIFAVENV